MDPDVAGDAPEHDVVAPARPGMAAAARRRQRATTPAPLRVAILVASTQGFWHGLLRPEVELWAPALVAGCGSAVGLVLTRWSWSLGSAGDSGTLAELEDRRSQSRCCHGFVAYPCIAVAKTQQPIAADEGPPAGILGRMQESLVQLVVAGALQAEQMNVREVLRVWQQEHGTCFRFAKLCTSPVLAAQIVLGSIAVCHIVGVGERICRKRLLFWREPSARAVAGLRERSARLRSRRLGPRVKRGLCKTIHDPEIVIEWLAATANVRGIRQSFQTARAFARIFAKHHKCSLEEVLGGIKAVSFECLRQARIRLDAVASLLFRRLWRQLQESAIDIYLYIDSSPQWHGEELFASSFEVWDRSGDLPWCRRLMPVVSLERDFLDGRGKTFALLFQIWLLVGPRPCEVRRFCRRVRCIVTDAGTERLVANFGDVLPYFLQRCELPVVLRTETHTLLKWRYRAPVGCMVGTSC